MGLVKAFYDSPKALRSLVREIAENSANVHIPFRRESHILNDISTSQIFSCLENGSILRIQQDTDDLHTKLCEISYFIAGQEVSIALAVDTQNKKLHVLHVE